MTARDRRQNWAAGFIRRGRTRGELPRYGSLAWLSLPDDDPRKVGAVCVAAECWAVEYDELAPRLHDEIAVGRQRLEDVDASRFAAVASSVRSHAGSPSWANIVERWNEVTLVCAAKDCRLTIDVDWTPGWRDTVAYCREHAAEQGAA